MTRPAVTCLVVGGSRLAPSADALAGIAGQRWPAGRIEVAEVSGPLAGGVERALAGTTGELVGFAAAGDAWLPEKLRLQADALAARPGAVAVHADVQPVDGAGVPERPSWFAASKLDGARGLAGVLTGGEPWTSTLVVRRAVLERMLPLPVGADSLGLYVAAHAAAEGELAFVPVPLARVRTDHPAAAARATGQAQLEPTRGAIRLVRWALSTLALDALGPHELAPVREHLDGLVACAAALAGRLRDADVSVRAADRAAWRRAMGRAGAERATGRPLAAARAYLAAGAADPFERHAREQLAALVEALR